MPMRVIVAMGGSELLALDMDTAATVGDLAAQVCSAAGLHHVRLRFAGTDLADHGRSLADMGIGAQATVEASGVPPCAAPPFVVKHNTDRHLHFGALAFDGHAGQPNVVVAKPGQPLTLRWKLRFDDSARTPASRGSTCIIQYYLAIRDVFCHGMLSSFANNTGVRWGQTTAGSGQDTTGERNAERDFVAHFAAPSQCGTYFMHWDTTWDYSFKEAAVMAGVSEGKGEGADAALAAVIVT